ncbi:MULTISPECIES: hypothetical protein [Burkholderiaceae]|uniref:hypothetical protein n=1 Tax=Burkholderiaceae TaxID=119060 RepID=UPI00074C3138|nr:MULTISPECIES: hypothetical protein [Burkholderiaceae]SAL57966.1 Xanthomonas avirulence protein, Avr/PthA [Caballeronia peredens]
MMLGRVAVSLLLIVLGIHCPHASAQTVDNLSNCLSGQYPALCRHDLLTPDQALAAKKAEYAHNLTQCLDGHYPALCRHEWLTSDQGASVDSAERRANFDTCIQGRYVALCNHAKLTPEQQQQVSMAEHRENLQVCRTGQYVALCRHQDLTAEEASVVRSAEHRVNQNNCRNQFLQALCRRDWLAEDEQEMRAQATSSNRGSSMPMPPTAATDRTATLANHTNSTMSAPDPSSRAGAPTPDMSGLIRPNVVTSPAPARCQNYWLGSIAASGEYAVLSDYSRITPVDTSGKTTLKAWQRGQSVVKCGAKLTNKDAHDSIAVKH